METKARARRASTRQGATTARRDDASLAVGDSEPTNTAQLATCATESANGECLLHTGGKGALVCLAALHVVIMGTSRDTEGNYGLLVNEDSDGYGDTKPSAAALAGYEAGLQAARQAAAASKGLDSAKKKPDAVIDVGTIAPHQLASPTPSTRSDISHRSDRSGRSALGSRSRATPTLPSVSLYSPRIERLRHRIHQGYVLTAQEMAELEAEDAKALKDKGKRGEEWSA